MRFKVKKFKDNGQTVCDLGLKKFKDKGQRCRYNRIWGQYFRFLNMNGQMVDLDLGLM